MNPYKVYIPIVLLSIGFVFLYIFFYVSDLTGWAVAPTAIITGGIAFCCCLAGIIYIVQWISHNAEGE